jgi:hypothetical protein
MNRNSSLHLAAPRKHTSIRPCNKIYHYLISLGERTRSYDRGGVPRTNPSSEQSKESVSDDGLLARACCREWHPATGFPMTDTEREAEGQPYNYLFFCIYISSIFLPLPSFPPTLKRIKRSRSTHTYTQWLQHDVHAPAFRLCFLRLRVLCSAHSYREPRRGLH